MVQRISHGYNLRFRRWSAGGNSPQEQKAVDGMSALQRAALKWGMAGIIWGGKFSIATRKFDETFYLR